MNHLYNTKPHFQFVIDKQRIAHHRLNTDLTTRTPAERSNFERTLEPVPVSDVELPKLPLVRLRDVDDGKRYVILGEIAQLPGRVIVMEVTTGIVDVSYKVDQLELVPPSELA